MFKKPRWMNATTDEEIDFGMLYVHSPRVQLTHWCKSKINPETENAGEENP